MALGFGGIKIKRQTPLVDALKIFDSVSSKLKITVDLMGGYQGDFLPVLREMEAIGNVLVLEDPPPSLQSLPQPQIAAGLAEYHKWSAGDEDSHCYTLVHQPL